VWSNERPLLLLSFGPLPSPPLLFLFPPTFDIYRPFLDAFPVTIETKGRRDRGRVKAGFRPSPSSFLLPAAVPFRDPPFSFFSSSDPAGGKKRGIGIHPPSLLSPLFYPFLLHSVSSEFPFPPPSFCVILRMRRKSSVAPHFPPPFFFPPSSRSQFFFFFRAGIARGRKEKKRTWHPSTFSLFLPLSLPAPPWPLFLILFFSFHPFQSARREGTFFLSPPFLLSMHLIVALKFFPHPDVGRGKKEIEIVYPSLSLLWHHPQKAQGLSPSFRRMR